MKVLNYTLILVGVGIFSACLLADPMGVLYTVFGIVAFLCGVMGIETERRKQRHRGARIGGRTDDR